MARELVDDEFGAIRIKRIASSRHVRVRVTATGQISAKLPVYSLRKGFPS